MIYDFDEIIDRKNTNCENVEGFRSYMFADEPDIELPVPDDELVRMWVADMEFAAAPEICAALHERTEKRIFGYTSVFDSRYYDAFSAWCRKRYGWEFPREELVFSPGVIPALYELTELLTEPDEKVLFTTPSYGFFKHACRYSGRQFISSDLINEGGHFRVNLEDFAAKAADPDVKLVIWCNPHNPTGRVWTEAEAREIAEIVEKNDLWIVSDEIHCDLTRKNRQHIPMGKIMPDYRKLVTCMAASKTFNLAGMLFSNIIIRDAELRREFVRRNKLGESVNPLSLAAYQAAYEKGAPWLDQLQDYLDANFEFAVKFIRENIPGAVCEVPEATYLLWVDMNGTALNRCGGAKDTAGEDGVDMNGAADSNAAVGEDSIDMNGLSKFFAKDAGVLVESGDKLFVGNAEGFVRINLAMPRAVVKKGLERIAAAIEGKAL